MSAIKVDGDVRPRRLVLGGGSDLPVVAPLFSLAADSPFGGGDGKGSWRKTAAVLAMLLGAIAGALLLKAYLALALALAALLAILTWALFIPAARVAEKCE